MLYVVCYVVLCYYVVCCMLCCVMLLCCMVLKLTFITTYKRKDKTVARSFLGTVMDGEGDEMPCKCH